MSKKKFNSVAHGPAEMLEAVKNSDVEQVRRLLDAGGDVNARDDEGMTLLIWASLSFEREPLVKLLLERDADVNLADTREGQTPLIWATRHGRNGNVKLILQKKPEIDARDRQGRSVLMHAAIYGYPRIAHNLLKQGADPLLTDKSGKTAMDHVPNPTPGDLVLRQLQRAVKKREKITDEAVAALKNGSEEKFSVRRPLNLRTPSGSSS